MNIFVIAFLPTVASVLLIGLIKNMFLFFIVYQICICLLAPVLKLKKVNQYGLQDSFQYLGLEKPNIKNTIIGFGVLLLFFAVLFTTLFVSNKLSLIETKSFVNQISACGVPINFLPLMFLFMVIANAFAEEMFWRGFVANELKGSMSGKIKPYFVSSFFYALYHLPILYLFVQEVFFLISSFLSIFIAGVVWAYLRDKYQTTWISIMGHYGATFAYMLFLYLCLGG